MKLGINDKFEEDDLTSGARDYAGAQIEIGVVGWSDEDEWYEKGAEDNDGHTLVRVQLYRGKPGGESPKTGEAHGHRILCHIADHIFRIPAKGTRCYVAIPHGFETIPPGAAIIVACLRKTPVTQFEEDRVVMDFGPDNHVIIKGKSVALSDHNAPANSLSVGTPRTGGPAGVLINLPDGTGAVWQPGVVGIFATASTLISMTDSKFEVWQSAGSVLQMTGGNFTSIGAVNKMQGAGCYIGKAPTPANPVLWGFSGVMGVASPSVFVSPI
jgi:hypothetical protein